MKDPITHLGQLLTYAAIEARLGEPAEWEGDSESWTIVIARDAVPSNTADWHTQHKWLSTRLEKFIKVFKPY